MWKNRLELKSIFQPVRIDLALLLIDAFLYSLGKDKGFIKDAQKNDLRHGLSAYRLKNGKFEKDWFASH